MKLLEIKNNLAKISYTETETPVLGRFIVLATESKSYVAQFVNLKSDSINNFAIAKLIFTFTPDGVVDNYDGSIPSISSELSFLPAEELLNLLPVETAVKIGNLAQLEDMLSVDISVFERNFTVFCEKDTHKTTFISNCVRQLFRMKEKSVIIDTDNLFEDYKKIVLGKDFKLPLNSQMIDYIFEYELADVDAATKAVIQDIFYAVQQYIKTLDYEFLPIDNFVEVVTNQYKEMQLPELALLKNKLLKYRDANVFANSTEEIFALKNILSEKNCSIIDLKEINESLQKEVYSFIHTTLTEFDKYIYFFVPLTDNNSDKQLLKQLINNNHIFTTFLASSEYKYAQELKRHAQNLILFEPMTTNHEFTAFNTFLNKLNPDECIVYGKLTQGIPFIVEMADLELDLTKDDVLGEKYQFVPVSENLQLVTTDNYGNQTPVELYDEPETPQVEQSYDNEQEAISSIPQIDTPPIEMVEDLPTDNTEENEDYDEVSQTEHEEITSNEIQPVGNILSEENEFQEETNLTETDLTLTEQDMPTEDFIPEAELEEDEISHEPLTEDDLDFIDETQFEQTEVEEDMYLQDDITADEDEIVEDTYDELSYSENQPPVVPVYTEDDNLSDTNINELQQGDSVTHPRYGRGVVEKIIKYGNKTLCSISFENVGRRLLDPSISDLTKLA
ncbi:MAG: hypothetical protein ACI37Q_03810 [Candidatus Gastranaerophilaceae bacterium]